IARWRAQLYQEQCGYTDATGKQFPAREVSLEETATLLVAEIAVSSVHMPQNVPHGWADGCMFINRHVSEVAINGAGPHHDAYRELVAKWIDTRKTPAELRALGWYLPNVLRSFKESYPAMSRVILTRGVVPQERCNA